MQPTAQQRERGKERKKREGIDLQIYWVIAIILDRRKRREGEKRFKASA